VLTVALIFLWFIPVAFAQSLVSAQNLQKTFPWLTPLFEENPTLMALIMGYLPALIVSLFLLLIPILTRGAVCLANWPCLMFTVRLCVSLAPG
jgi:hypothetical protein